MWFKWCWNYFICQGGYSFQLNYNRKQTNRKFLCRAKLCNYKWLINCSYNLRKSLIDNHKDQINQKLDFYSSKLEKVLFFGDFNVDIEEKHTKCFCDNYNLKSSIKQPTCYNNSESPTRLHLLKTNRPRIFQSTCVLEKWLSDFHLMTLTVMGKSFRKLQPRIINYRAKKNLLDETSKCCFLNQLRKEDFINNDRVL